MTKHSCSTTFDKSCKATEPRQETPRSESLALVFADRLAFRERSHRGSIAESDTATPAEA